LDQARVKKTKAGGLEEGQEWIKVNQKRGIIERGRGPKKLLHVVVPAETKGEEKREARKN